DGIRDFHVTGVQTCALPIFNKALGGTSSRSYFTNRSLWQQILDSLRPGDIVLMQFGHNDSSPIVDSARARGTIRGNSDDYQEVRSEERRVGKAGKSRWVLVR